jgi:mRNA degradation ribonuclease J1/J2
VGLRADVWVNSNGASLSDKTHVTERWSLGANGRLAVSATVEDPVRLTKSYTVSNSYGKVTDTKRMVQQACYENVREVLEGDKIMTQFGAGT